MAPSPSNGRLGLVAGPGVRGIPPELLLKICSYLCRHCQGGHATVVPEFQYEADVARVQTTTVREGWVLVFGRPALRNLTRTCRTLRAAAEPFLYHYFSTTSKRSLALFVQTLEEIPDLQVKVSEVNVPLVS